MRRWLPCLLLLFVAMNVTSHSLAHADGLRVGEPALTEFSGETFLSLTLSYPKSDDPLELSAIVVGDKSAVLEQRSNGVYRPLEHLSVSGPLRLGTQTPYRIRVPGSYQADQRVPVPVTFLFSGGALVSLKTKKTKETRQQWSWSWLLIGALVLVVGATGYRYRKRGDLL